MEAGSLTVGDERTLGERFANFTSRLNQAPFVVKAGLGIFVLDLVLVLADRRPDSAGEWVTLLIILAASIAATLPMERRPAAIAAVVLANIVAILVLYHGVNDVTQRGINGLSLGAIYALGAVGLTLVYGILKLVNFAHGDFLTFGAYMAYLVNVTWGAPLVVAIFWAMLMTAILGIVLERLLWGPMRTKRAGLLQFLLAAIGLAFLLRAIVQWFWGTEIRSLDVNQTSSVEILGLRIGQTELIVVIVGLVVLVAVGLMLRWTLLGKRMRALSDDLELAETAGIDTRRVILWTWIFAGALAGLAGVMAASVTSLYPEMGFELLLPIFAAVVLGGIGDAFGALAAGVVIGVMTEWSTLIIDARWKTAVGFLVLLIVLIVRPQGIFGRAKAL
jgi:neutral amino acid transport system permease protein